MTRLRTPVLAVLALAISFSFVQQPPRAAASGLTLDRATEDPSAGESRSAALSLRSVPVLADVDVPFDVVLDVDTAGLPPEDLEVGLRVGSRVLSRQALRSADENPSRRSPHVRIPVTTGPDGRSTVRFSPVVATSGTRTAERLVLRGNGVHPLTFSLRSRRTGETLDRVVTYAIRLDDTPEEPLSLAWLWPVRTPPGDTPDDVEALEGDLNPNGRLSVILEEAAASPAPITLVPSPETLQRTLELIEDGGTEDGSSRRADGAADALADVARSIASDGHGVLSPPYAHLEPTAIGDTGGLDDPELTRQLSQGAGTLQLALGQGDVASPKVLDGPEVPSSALSRLRAAGVDTVVVEDGAIDVPNSREIPPTLARPFAFEEVPGLTGVRADPGLRADLAEDDGPVAAAQRLIADLTVLYLERPAHRRGAVLHPGTAWAPSRQLLTETTRRLDSVDHVEASTLPGLLDTVPVQTVGTGRSEEPLEVTLDAPDATSPLQERRDRATVSNLHAGLDQALTLVCASAGSCAGLQSLPEELETVPEELTRADRELMTAADEAIAGTVAFSAWTEEAEQTIDAVLSGISIPENVELTLTSREGTIPVSIQNAAPWPLYVRVTLRSGPVEFDDGQPEASRDVLVPPGNFTVDVPITAPSRGDYGIQAEVTSPAGSDLVLARRTMTIHSTAVNEVAVALTVLSLLFLGLWWVVEVVLRRRRHGKHSAEPSQPPAGPPLAPPPVRAGKREPAGAATGVSDGGSSTHPTSGPSP